MTDLLTPHSIDKIEKAHHRLDDHEKRLTRIETNEMVAGERQKHIEKSLSSIEANQSRLVWLVITALVAGLMAFALNGGLNVN